MTLLAVLLPLFLAAPADKTKTDFEAAKAAIRKADVDFCKATGERDAKKAAAFLADDITFFPGEKASGRETFLKTWAPFFTEGGPTLTWEPTFVDVAASGDLGYSVGDYERKAKDAQGRLTVGHGHYVTIWRKQTDGSWKAVLDIGTPPSPTTKP